VILLGETIKGNFIAAKFCQRFMRSLNRTKDLNFGDLEGAFVVEGIVFGVQSSPE
jgi:hypothetical protein